MRKEILPFFLLLIVIIALACSMWYFQKQIGDANKQSINLEAQLSDLQNPTYNVTIANVSSASWGNPAGMALDKTFYITIKNNGDRDVGGLMIEFKILADGNVTNNDEFQVIIFSPMQFGVLHVQESKVVSVGILTSYDVSRAGKSLAVTLMLDEFVLDECELSLAAWQGF